MSVGRRQFMAAAAVKAADLHHRAVVQKNIAAYEAAVARSKARWADWESARRQAARLKWEAINQLDRYLEQFERNVLANGGHVHWAETAADACRLVVGLAQRHSVRKVVKAKSMVTEEIGLNEALAAAGIEPIETDLGEFICQLRGEPPYHIVTPVMHLTRAEIAQTFHAKFGTALDATAEELAGVARQRLRQQFLSAQMGVTGANFAIAESGMIALSTNEGNGRLCASLPPIHVAIVGIEKLIPRLSDLALFWPLLATGGTGQALTCYNTLVGGPRRDGERDGPAEFHVVLLDNGRTRLLADGEQRDALHCIRCGACLNACPVYKTVGGHSYGTTYQGPIGAVITPHLRDLGEWAHLPAASSLCGACTDVCPVKVALHHHLLHNRRNTVRGGFDAPLERLAFRLWLWLMQDATRYRLAGKLLRFARPFARPWTNTRELPAVPRQSFREWWSEHGPGA